MAQNPETNRVFSDEVRYGHGNDGIGGVPVDMIVDPAEATTVPTQPGAEDISLDEIRAAVQAAVDESNKRADDGLRFDLLDVEVHAPRDF